MDDISSKVSGADYAYYNGLGAKLATGSSTLISSSPYLNHPELRALIAQEMLRRNGPDLPSTAYIPNVVKILMEMEDWPRLHQVFEEEKARLPDFKAWLEGREISLFKADELQGAEPGTLRSMIHDFVVNSGYNMDHFWQGMEIKTDFEFSMKERTHTHDIEHMISGFETNHCGEVALLAANARSFYSYFEPELAAFFNRVGGYLKAKTVMKSSLFYPEVFAAELDAEDIGAAQGRAWKRPLFMIPYRRYLDWRIADIREEFGIVNVPPPGVWAWTTAKSGDHHELPMAIAAE